MPPRATAATKAAPTKVAATNVANKTTAPRTRTKTNPVNQGENTSIAESTGAAPKPRAPRASRAKAAAPATPTVNTQQFSGNMSHLGGLYTGMTEAGLTADSPVNDHMSAYRRTLFHAAATTAAEHPTLGSLGHSLDVNPTMHGFNNGDAVTGGKQSRIGGAIKKIGSFARDVRTVGTAPSKKYSLLDHARSGSNKGKKNQQRKPTMSGNNSRVLRGATGAL